MEKNIYNVMQSVLRRTGPIGYYKGIDQLTLCVEYVLNNAESIRSIQKEVYPTVAQKTNCAPHCIERNIRKVLAMIDKEELADITGVKVIDDLTPKKRINLFSNYIRYIENSQ